MNKIFQQYFLDDLVFRLVAILKSINKIFEKTISKKSIFKIGTFESINKILEKYLQINLHFRKLFCIYEQNLWNTPVKEFFFFQFTVLLVIFVIVLNVPLIKCLTSVLVNYPLETPCLFRWCIMKTK